MQGIKYDFPGFGPNLEESALYILISEIKNYACQSFFFIFPFYKQNLRQKVGDGLLISYLKELDVWNTYL